MSPDSSEAENPSQPTVNGNQQEHTTSDHQDIPASLQQERTIPEPPVTQPLTQPFAKDEQWKADQRKNWIWQLLPQWALVAVSVGAVIAAFSTLTTLNETLDAARNQAAVAQKSADIAQATLLASRRPLVSVDVSIGGDWEYADAVTLEVQYAMKNHGPTPAVKVYISPTMLLSSPGDDRLIVSTQRKMCGFGKQNPPMNSLGGYTLFPQQDRNEHSGFDLSKRSIEIHLKDFKGPPGFPPVFITPFIVGCVTYRSTSITACSRHGLTCPPGRVTRHSLNVLL